MVYVRDLGRAFIDDRYAHFVRRSIFDRDGPASDESQ